jgi:predicted ATPase/DNA-binding CsgD family transcriptional regulator
MQTPNLPSQTMSFIGRSDEITGIIQRLADPACGLLTLVGPGGIGKTRLAIEVAKTIADTDAVVDGIYFVDLQPINASDLLVTAISNSVGIILSGSDEPRAQLLSYLNGRNSLLLLDNFEQLLDSVDLLADILKIAPDIKLLVTSREALNIQEEWVWQVGGLQVPDNQHSASIESYSAVQLFAERARRTRRDFVLTGQESPITRTCQLVEGMPLALELAASWTKVLSCAEIADEIQRSLDFLTTNTRNIPERHRSMQAVFDHSWRLLTDAERAAFPQLSVFRGGFRREAAEQVAGASLVVLSGLVDKSFLRLSASGRYEVHELMRQYGEEHLEAVRGTKEDAQKRHCLYYADFLHQRQATLRTPQQATALDEIEAELDNVRLSWEWAVEHDMADTIYQSMHSLYLVCHIRAHAVEGERLFDLAFERFEHEDSAMLGYILPARMCFEWFNGHSSQDDEYHRALQLAYRFWNDDDIAIHLPSYISRNAVFARKLFDYERQEQVYHDFFERFRTHGQSWGAIFMVYCLGELHYGDGQLDKAETCFRQSLNDFLHLGDRWASCWSSTGLGLVLESSQQYWESFQMWQLHQDICAEVGDRGGVVFALAKKANIMWRLQDYHTARNYIAQSIKSHLEVGSPLAHLVFVFRVLSAVFVSEGRHESAAELLSFLRQHADRLQALDIMDEANQNLDSIAEKLSAQVYQQAVERGKTLHLRTILEQLLDELSDYAPPSAAVPHADTLTERELEVLRLAAAGHSNRQIARDLFLTLNTVKSHIHHIYNKLGVGSRMQAVARARDLNLL